MTRRKKRTLIAFFLLVILFFSSSFSLPSLASLGPIENCERGTVLNSSDSNNSNQSYYAIIVGIDHYQNDVQSDRVNINETALEIYSKLISGKNWNEKNIKLLINENATKTNIKSAFLDWLNPLEKTDDVILFYFIGKTKKTIQFTQNTISFCYDSSNSEDHSDKITDKELDIWLDGFDSEHICIILDTSFANNMYALPQRGRVILRSNGFLFPRTNPTDTSLSHTPFSNFVIKALSGYADTNGNGKLDLEEIFYYAKTQSFQHSLQIFFSSLKKLDFRFHPQLPSMSNRHVGRLSLFTLPFGWKKIAENGFGRHSNYATRGMTLFHGDLYIGTQNNLLPKKSGIEEQPPSMLSAVLFPDFYELFGGLTTLPSRLAMHVMTFVSQGCEIWKYNYTTDTLSKVIGKHSLSGVSSGFGSHFNAAAAVMKEYKDYLYVGTWNTPIGTMREPNRKGCEIWRTNDGLHWEQVVGHNAAFTPGGFGNPDNTGAWSIEVFQGYLYVGTMNWDFSDTGGCEIWRSNDGLHWEQVVDHGFRCLMNTSYLKKEPINTYAWDMQEYHGKLYLGTFNSRIWFHDEEGTGCQLWRTHDGEQWEKVHLPNGLKPGFQDGFGEGENYGIRRMVVYNDELYCGIASSFFHDHGAEIWKYDEENWSPVISDEMPNIAQTDSIYDGFGNTMNKYVWSMVVTNDNKLWVGTGNGQVYLPFFYKAEKDIDYFTTRTEGCEIWCYDGEIWEPVIKNDIGLKPNGIGDSTNLGARSMIEYPENSGNLVVGTFKLFNSHTADRSDGCEIWMRYLL